MDSVKQQLKQARAAGDTDAEVELQDAMTNARYEYNTAEWEKNNFAKWKEQQAAKPATAAVENKSPYTAKEQAWINAHPEFESNKKFSRLAKVAAGEALEEGHKQDTPAYFEYIENALKESGFLSDGDPTSGAGKNMSTSSAAAPNKSGNGAAPPVNKNSKYPYVPNGFTIPKDWVEMATDLGFEDPREYANERLKIEAEDKSRI